MQAFRCASVVRGMTGRADRLSAEKLRRALVASMKKEGVLQAAGVEAAFAAVPRHVFLPGIPLEQVYSDRAIGLKHDADGLLVSSSSQPTMMALMLNQVGLKPGDNVLEIGTATGYNAAILKYIVGEQGHVTTIELDKDLADQAQRNLRRSRVRNVHVVNDDGARGYAPRASYDHIVVTVGTWDIPPAWFQQLKPDGSLVVPLVIDGVQVSATFVPQDDGTFLSRVNRPCAFVYMRGLYAGPQIRKQIGSTSMYLMADQVAQIDTAALHSLLSDDHEVCYVESWLEQTTMWNGFQIYLMLNEPPDSIFALFAVAEGQKAYGVEGRGVALFMPGSAVLMNYHDKGQAHCFAGSDAYLLLQHLLDEWNRSGQPSAQDLRIRLVPKTMKRPNLPAGKVYERRDHYVCVWFQ